MLIGLLDRVYCGTPTTGTGSVAVGAKISNAFLTPASAGAVDGQSYRWMLEDGNDFEIFAGTYSATGPTVSRDTVNISCIAGTVGTTKLNLSGSATLRVILAAEDIAAVLAAGAPSMPQGRLTLTTGVPVLSSTVSGAATIYYTPYVGQYVPIYNGSSFDMKNVGGELSQATTDATKSPAACTTNANYDLFVWNDSGTFRCTRGPAWTTSTPGSAARGTGAGTTELQLLNGILTNKNAITNGPGANLGTYVGTIRTNGSSQVDYILGGSASGGTAGVLNVWNMYNRRLAAALVKDSGASYTYNGVARQARASAGNQISFLLGLLEDSVAAGYTALAKCTAVTSATSGYGIGVNSTSTFFQSPNSGLATSSAFAQSGATSGCSIPLTSLQLGSNFVAALEVSNNASNSFDLDSNSALTVAVMN